MLNICDKNIPNRFPIFRYKVFIKTLYWLNPLFNLFILHRQRAFELTVQVAIANCFKLLFGDDKNKDSLVVFLSAILISPRKILFILLHLPTKTNKKLNPITIPVYIYIRPIIFKQNENFPQRLQTPIYQNNQSNKKKIMSNYG